MTNQKELQMGIKVEMEHTNDPRLAEKIACDHLREDPHYYTKLNNAGLADELPQDNFRGDVMVVNLSTQPSPQSQGEATPSKPLTSSNLGTGNPVPLTSTVMQAPKGNNVVPNLSKTPPKLPTKDVAMGDSTGLGMPVQDEEGNQKPNSVRVDGTPGVGGETNCNFDPMDFFGSQISKALQPEVPRRLEVIPANIYEGGASLKKK